MNIKHFLYIYEPYVESCKKSTVGSFAKNLYLTFFSTYERYVSITKGDKVRKLCIPMHTFVCVIM